LAVALAFSLLMHGVCYVTWRIAPALKTFAMLVIQRALPDFARELKPAMPQTPTEPPIETAMTFVEVDPALASAVPPKETKNYSTRNSVAVNPEPKKAEAPKIDGTQTRMLRMMDNPKPKPVELQPTVPALSPTPAPKPEPPKPELKPEKPAEVEKPKPATPIGDLAMVKPEKRPEPSAPEPKPQRPRTLREAAQRNPSLAGQKTLQEGGVPRRGHISMVDAKSSAFGEYDYAFIRAVEQRWYQLLDDNQYLLDRQGKVALQFRLHFDGRISDMQVADNTVGDILSLLCQKAILDPAPFPKWPNAMRQAVRGDFRDVRFTFYYD
jgi:hypothetical protein